MSWTKIGSSDTAIKSIEVRESDPPEYELYEGRIWIISTTEQSGN